MNWKRALLRVLLFACFGSSSNCFSRDSAPEFQGNWNLRGHSSPWMMPIYGLLGIVAVPVSDLKRRNIPFVLRAFVYMLLIFFVEYVSKRGI